MTGKNNGNFLNVTANTLRDGNPCLKDQLEDLKHVGNIMFLEDIKSINIHNWKKVALNRDSWNKVVQQARTLYRL